MAYSRTQKTPKQHFFYCIADDHFCTYGEVGENFLQYPIWMRKALNLNKCRERLVEALDKLNEQRQDYHDEPSPVEDIIDPDVLICHPDQFDRDIWIKRRTKEVRHYDGLWEEEGFETLEEKVAFQLDEEVTEHVKLRSTYQWMPTKFVTDLNVHVTITTAIPQLERTPENEQIYQDITEVFAGMLPAFQKKEIVRRSAQSGNTLQVIVKAQSYNLKAGERSSTSRVHTIRRS